MATFLLGIVPVRDELQHEIFDLLAKDSFKANHVLSSNRIVLKFSGLFRS